MSERATEHVQLIFGKSQTFQTVFAQNAKKTAPFFPSFSGRIKNKDRISYQKQVLHALFQRTDKTFDQYDRSMYSVSMGIIHLYTHRSPELYNAAGICHKKKVFNCMLRVWGGLCQPGFSGFFSVAQKPFEPLRTLYHPHSNLPILPLQLNLQSRD